VTRFCGIAACWLGFVSIASMSAASGAWLQRTIHEAKPGATIHVPAGVHRGELVVDKPLHLIGEPGATIEGGGRGHVIAITAPDVEIAGLLIRRSGSNLSTDDAGIHVSAPRATIRGNTIVDTLHGVYLRQAPECRLLENVIRGRASADSIADPMTRDLRLSSAELCSVELEQNQRGNGIHIWNCSGHLIEQNDIRGTRDGIYFSFCDNTNVRRNVIRNVRYGLHYMYSDGNVFEQNLFTENAAGAALMYSSGIVLRENRFAANRSHRAYGLLMHTVEQTRIEENEFDGNTIGSFVENSTGNQFRGNRVTGNYIGVRVSGSSDTNVFWQNEFVGNIHSVETGGSATSNAWSADGVGNFWQDAVKLDLSGDGIADVPHHEVDLFGEWRRNLPEIGLLSGSPGERALRVVHARLGVPGIRSIRDPRPLANRMAQ
jgi:nitrous oxidase accessory protein